MTFPEEVVGDCRLILGDCLDVMPTLRAQRVHLVLADPPYGRTQNTWDKPIPLQDMWAAIPAQRETPVLLTAAQPFASALVTSALDRFRYDWIWEKTEASGHLNAKKMPLRAHEHVLVFCETTPQYFPQKTSGHPRKTAKNVDRGSKQSTSYGSQHGVTNYDSTERYPRSVLVFQTDKQKGSRHPTQKPVSLMEYMIRTYTQKGDTVLDFTMGSGTTGVACVNTGRKFIGIEKSHSYFDVAVSRIKGVNLGQPSLFGGGL